MKQKKKKSRNKHVISAEMFPRPKSYHKKPEEGKIQKAIDEFIKDFEQHLMFIAGILIGVGIGVAIGRWQP